MYRMIDDGLVETSMKLLHKVKVESYQLSLVSVCVTIHSRENEWPTSQRICKAF